MKVGANNKRNVIILSVLAVIGVYVLWTNVFSSSDNDDGRKTTATAAPASVPAAASKKLTTASVDPTQSRRDRMNRSNEWNPPYKQPGVIIDPIKVDPTLRLDILSKVQNVEINSDAQRNLFQFGAPPKAIDPTPIKSPAQIAMGKGPKGPAPPPGPPPKPAEEVAPPIPLKYYGFATPRTSSNKRAFFLDNDDIIVASEGELIKRRYKLVKIGVNSVTMEDSQFKSQQTLPLAPDAAS